MIASSSLVATYGPILAAGVAALLLLGIGQRHRRARAVLAAFIGMAAVAFVMLQREVRRSTARAAARQSLVTPDTGDYRVQVGRSRGEVRVEVDAPRGDALSSIAETVPPAPAIAPHPPIRRALPPPAPEVDDEEQGTDERAGEDAPEVADLRELGPELRAALRAPIARYVERELVAGAWPMMHDICAAASDPAPDDPDAERPSEHDLIAAARRLVTEKLARYFDSLAEQPAPRVRKLAELRLQIKALSTQDRRRVAEEVAKLRETLAEYRADDPESGTHDRVLRLAVPPERITQLIRTAHWRPAASRTHRWSTGQVVLATIGVLLGATVVLKAATRRHVHFSRG